MKTIVTYYKGVLRCQFSTQRTKELGKEHRTIFRHIELEPTFEFYITEVVSEETYFTHLQKLKTGPFLPHFKKEVIDFYHHEFAPDGKRMYADEIWMGIETEPKIIDNQTWDWNELRFDSIPNKYLHDCFIAYHPNTNHGRISGPVIIKRVQTIDDEGKEVFEKINTEVSGDSFLERQGCFHQSRGCIHRIYSINYRIKNWINSLFGGFFGANIIGNEPNGCLPTMLPSGCSGAGCRNFGCGILSLLSAIVFLLWLFRCLLFGECGNHVSNKDRVVEKIIHDTIYIEKNSKVDTLTYVDETTNTTVKMLSLPNVQFEKNKAILLRSSIPQLNELAAYLMENRDIAAEIIGHTDADGDAEANRVLSKERAEAVIQYLIKNGVKAQRLKATGKGESEPVTENSSAEGRAMNRRVEVKLSEASTSKTTRTQEDRKVE
jgi:outer membrane protein OmpA-like peptidoglycan-associated protein